jgi:hypothetical protein
MPKNAEDENPWIFVFSVLNFYNEKAVLDFQ